MSSPIKMVQGDLVFQADLTQPAFSLLQSSSKLYQALFAALSRYGLRLGDMKPEQGSGTLGDLHLQCSFYNFTTSLRVRLERIELTCFDLTRVERGQLEEVTVSALEALSQSLSPDVSFKTYSLGISLHGLLAEGEVKDFLGRFVTAIPKDLGPSLGAGCIFYFGAEAERVTSSLAMDLSAVVENGLFLRLQVVWDAEKVEIKAIPTVASQHIENALAQVGLVLSQP
jgi:hypothetical protein